MRLWRPVRRLRVMWQHGLSEVDVRGLEHVRQAMEDGYGVLITPNHPSHADPFVLLEAADRLGSPFYFMTAWQVFAMTHRLGRRLLRQHGCFSINREGHDLRAYRQSVEILDSGTHPLVIFPEGEVFHLNDRVMPFRRGAATAALRAARRSGRPVACIPCGMKFRYATDPMPQLFEITARLEERMSWSPRPEMPLVLRIRNILEGMLNLKELEHFGETRRGSLRQRWGELLMAILGRLEDRYGIVAPKGTVPERVKQVRHRAIAGKESTDDTEQKARYQRDLDDLFVVMQLYSYPPDYLSGRPSIERLAETLDKLEEDLLGVEIAGKRGIRRAVISFGEPVMASPFNGGPEAAAALTVTLRRRVQELIDEINEPVRLPVEPTSLEVPARIAERMETGVRLAG